MQKNLNEIIILKEKIMNTNKIYWKDAVNILESGHRISSNDIDMRNDLIPVQYVALLNQNGIRIPKDRVFYDDENIDCSDIPEITEEDLLSGKLRLVESEEQTIDSEIKEWAKENKINLALLMRDLLRNFYQTMKLVQKETVL